MVKLETKVENCDVIVMGHLKWNPYFGESEEQPPRGDPSTCTSTMVRGTDRTGKPYVLLVDPTLRNCAEEYYFDVNRRTGLGPEAVTHCFITHEHFDHQAGVRYFPDARWLAAEPVAEKLKDSPYIDGSRVLPVSGELFPGVRVVPLPGHTMSLHGLEIRWENKRILIAGDSVMTRRHFEEETGMFEENRELGAETIRKMKEVYDIIVPGHDNWFWGTGR